LTGLTERRLARLAEWSAASGVHGCTATARTGWTSASAGKLRTGAAEGIARSRITRTTTDGLGLTGPPVPPLTAYTSYADAQKHFSPDKLWELFDGVRERLNIAHECVDRHATDPARVAVILAHADGRDEELTFAELARDSSRFAHWLVANGVGAGDRVAVMLEPSRAFYVAVFGAMKAGAIAVPLFTLFGPDGIRLRVHDCSPKLLLTNAEKAPMATGT